MSTSLVELGPPRRRARLIWAFWLIRACTLLFICALEVRADVGPPVKIRMPVDTALRAVSEQEYSGVIEILVIEGTLDSIAPEGDGWELRSLNAPTKLGQTERA